MITLPAPPQRLWRMATRRRLIGCDSSPLSLSAPETHHQCRAVRLIHPSAPSSHVARKEKAACACRRMAPRTEPRRDGDVLMCEQRTRFRVPVVAKTRSGGTRRPLSAIDARACQLAALGGLGVPGDDVLFQPAQRRHVNFPPGARPRARGREENMRESRAVQLGCAHVRGGCICSSLFTYYSVLNHSRHGKLKAFVCQKQFT
jgi:hypothetical protein